MRRPAFTALFLSLPLALAACGNKAPSERIEETIDEAVETVSGTATPALAEGPYAPRDECGDLEGAAAFRQQIADAVEARDAGGLAALAAEDVKLDFGGATGRILLREWLSDEDHMLWDELDALTGLGCAAGNAGGIVLPWYWAQDIDAVDPMMGMIVTGERVPLHRAASDNSEVLESISWDVVELVGGLRPDDAFQKVRATDGTEGFIATERLRSLIDYRLTAISRDGRWHIVTLLAGD